MWEFLDSEKKVILGLVEDASRTDAEIAEMFSLKKGTVASIRRRLLRTGAIDIVNVPSFNKLGCEILSVHIGTLDATNNVDARLKYYSHFTAMSPQIWSGMIAGTSVIFHTAMKNATESGRFATSYNSYFTGPRRPFKAKLVSIAFPVSTSMFTYRPNFAPKLYRHFGIRTPSPKCYPATQRPIETPDFTETAREVLVALVEDPLVSDRIIAAKLKRSRQSVTRIRNKLFDDGVLMRCCIPRVNVWGFEVAALAHARFNMEIPWQRRISTQPRDVMELPLVAYSKPDEGLALYIFAKYSEYADSIDEMLTWYHKVKAFDEKPNLVLYPFERTSDLRSYVYGPAVRSLLMG